MIFYLRAMTSFILTVLYRHSSLDPSLQPPSRAANLATVRTLLGRWGSSIRVPVSAFLNLLRPKVSKAAEVGGGRGGAAQQEYDDPALAPPAAKRARQGGGGAGASRASVPDHQVVVALKLLSAVLMYGQGEELLKDEEAGKLKVCLGGSIVWIHRFLYGPAAG